MGVVIDLILIVLVAMLMECASHLSVEFRNLTIRLVVQNHGSWRKRSVRLHGYRYTTEERQ